MWPSHATKKGRRYRYYVSADLVEGSVETGAKGWRIPAEEIEAALASVIAVRLRDPGFTSGLMTEGHLGTQQPDVVLRRIATIATALDAPSSKTACDLLRVLIARVDLCEAELRATINFEALASGPEADPMDVALSSVSAFEVTAAIRLARRGAELRIVLQGAAAPPPKPDAQLIQALIEARCRVADYLEESGRINISDMARRDGIHPSDVSRSMQLAFLAPDIVERILGGAQPEHLTSESLKRIGELPLGWDDQRALLS